MAGLGLSGSHDFAFLTKGATITLPHAIRSTSSATEAFQSLQAIELCAIALEHHGQYCYCRYDASLQTSFFSADKRLLPHKKYLILATPNIHTNYPSICS